jgi:hypothetical protein
LYQSTTHGFTFFPGHPIYGPFARYNSRVSSGKFYADSKVWAKVPFGGRVLETWRGFHQPHGAPHPPSWEAEDLVLEVMPRLYLRFFDHMHAFVWACETPVHDGPVVFVVFPWCARCNYRSRNKSA